MWSTESNLSPTVDIESLGRISKHSSESQLFATRTRADEMVHKTCKKILYIVQESPNQKSEIMVVIYLGVWTVSVVVCVDAHLPTAKLPHLCLHYDQGE
jgi:hypothetical protein